MEFALDSTAAAGGLSGDACGPTENPVQRFARSAQRGGNLFQGRGSLAPTPREHAPAGGRGHARGRAGTGFHESRICAALRLRAGGGADHRAMDASGLPGPRLPRGDSGLVDAGARRLAQRARTGALAGSANLRERRAASASDPERDRARSPCPRGVSGHHRQTAARAGVGKIQHPDATRGRRGAPGFLGIRFRHANRNAGWANPRHLRNRAWRGIRQMGGSPAP